MWKHFRAYSLKIKRLLGPETLILWSSVNASVMHIIFSEVCTCRSFYGRGCIYLSLKKFAWRTKFGHYIKKKVVCDCCCCCRPWVPWMRSAKLRGHWMNFRKSREISRYVYITTYDLFPHPLQPHWPKQTIFPIWLNNYNWVRWLGFSSRCSLNRAKFAVTAHNFAENCLSYYFFYCALFAICFCMYFCICTHLIKYTTWR